MNVSASNGTLFARDLIGRDKVTKIYLTLQSRKFWTLIVGLLVVDRQHRWPILAAYILALGFEDGLREYASRGIRGDNINPTSG